MFRSDNAMRWICAALLVFVAQGCTTTSDQPEWKPEDSSVTVLGARKSAAVESHGAGGFIVSEVVRIDSDVRRDYQQASFLLGAGQIEAGAELLERVVERAPEVTVPHIDLGIAYVRLGEYEKAERSLQMALALIPNHPAALNELGILQRRTGRFEAARASYEQVLAIHPGFHFALLNLGVLCDLYLEDLACARSSYMRYAEIVVDDPQVDVWIADVENRLSLSVEE